MVLPSRASPGSMIDDVSRSGVGKGYSCAMSDVSQTDGVRRSAALLRVFRLEQSEPAIFYSALATDSVRMIEQHHSLTGATVIDVGAGRPQFASAFVDRGAYYVGVDMDAAELAFPITQDAAAVVGDGQQLPFRSGAADVVFASNVFEHVPAPRVLGDEIVRITKPGGIAVISYTNWLSPWGGHETSPFHYLGAQRAIRRYQRKYGHPAKNRVGETMFQVSVAEGLRWARSNPAVDIIDARPRYYPRSVSWIVKVPGVREVVTWNLWLVLRRK